MSCIGEQEKGCLLDVACGTGDFSIAAHRAGVKQVTGIDISENMVEIGKKKVGDLHLADAIELKTGDCEHMEFATGMFDVVTVAFGVRNFEHLELGLQEMYRVLKTGGKVIILEFSMPEHFPMKQLYRFYFCHIPEATYLGWLDFRAYGMTDQELWDFMCHKAKVATDDGPKFGPNGEAGGFQRINFSCPRAQLEEALNRIAEALDAL